MPEFGQQSTAFLQKGGSDLLFFQGGEWHSCRDALCRDGHLRLSDRTFTSLGNGIRVATIFDIQ